MIKKIHSLTTREYLIAIILLGLFLRLICFVGVGFNDDSYYLEYVAALYKTGSLVPPETVTWATRLGVYLPIVLFWKVFGITELSTSAYTLLSATLTIFVTYKLSNEFFSQKAGLIAALIIAVFPVDIIYSSQIGPDITFQLFSSLSILFFIRACKNIINEGKTFAGRYFVLSGLFLGICYATKSTFILTVIINFYVFTLYFYRQLFSKKLLHFIFTKRNLNYFVLTMFGFLCIYLLFQLFFYNNTNIWFFPEKTRSYSFTHDGNSNNDLWMYPNAWLNTTKDMYRWIHTTPTGGFLYITFLISSVFIIFKFFKTKTKELLFSTIFIFWTATTFFFFQYAVHFYCTEVKDYCLHPRHLRFMIIFSVPIAITISVAFIHIQKSISKFKYLSRTLNVVMAFLIISSISYAYQGAKFQRAGVLDIKETAEFTYELENKQIYLPEYWDISKFMYYFKYNETKLKNIVLYECNPDIKNCEDPNFISGETIHDAYVVTLISPYAYVNKNYPQFMYTPPESWILLREINNENRGIFSGYNPKIYYAP